MGLITWIVTGFFSVLGHHLGVRTLNQTDEAPMSDAVPMPSAGRDRSSSRASTGTGTHHSTHVHTSFKLCLKEVARVLAHAWATPSRASHRPVAIRHGARRRMSGVRDVPHHATSGLIRAIRRRLTQRHTMRMEMSWRVIRWHQMTAMNPIRCPNIDR